MYKGDSAPLFKMLPEKPPPYSPCQESNPGYGPGPSTPYPYPTYPPSPQQASVLVNVNVGNGGGTPQAGPRSDDILNPELLFCSSKLERNIFCRNVYAILSVQGLVVCGLIALLQFIPNWRTYFEELNFFKFWCFWTLGTIIACFITTLYKLMRKPPVNLVLLSLITVAAGFILGTLAARVKSQAGALICIGIVVGVCICVVIFTLQNFLPFTPLNSVCFVWSMNLVAYGILVLSFWAQWGDCGYLIIAPLVITTYFVTTTQLLMKDRGKAILKKEFVYGAVQVSMYLVAVFAKVLFRIFDKFCPCCACCCDGCGDVCNEL